MVSPDQEEGTLPFMKLQFRVRLVIAVKVLHVAGREPLIMLLSIERMLRLIKFDQVGGRAPFSEFR